MTINIQSIHQFNQENFETFIYNELGVSPILTGSRKYLTFEPHSDYDFYLPFTGNNKETISTLISLGFKSISYALPREFKIHFSVYRNGNVDILVCLSQWATDVKRTHDAYIMMLDLGLRSNRELQTALLYSLSAIQFVVIEPSMTVFNR